MVERITLEDAVKFFPELLKESVEIVEKQMGPVKESSFAVFQFAGHGYRTKRVEKLVVTKKVQP